jgi:hypothetical protein
MATEGLRCERKFRAENLPVEAVIQAVRLLPWGFRPVFPERRIHNIYFDTPGLDAFHDNAAGAPHRRKYRIRWYGDSESPPDDALFEMKERVNDRGFKQMVPSPPPGLLPVLSNTFRRLYFGLPGGQVRLTVDHDLVFKGVLIPTAPFPDPAVILELKYPAEIEGEMEPILQNLPFSVSKNSKYARGVELIFCH